MSWLLNRYVALTALLLIGLFAASWWSRDDADWRAATAWVTLRQQDWRLYGCAVLVGDRLDGCSRDDHAEALRLAARWPSALNNRLDELMVDEGQPKPAVLLDLLQTTELEQLTAPTAAAVTVLRRSTHRAHDVEADTASLGHDAEPLSDPLQLGRLFAALRLHALGGTHEPRAALSILVDGMIAATDVAAAGIGLERLIAAMQLRYTADACDDDLLRRLDDASMLHLNLICQRLLDALPPPGDFAERELAHFVVFFDAAPHIDAEDLFLRTRSLWTSGFSARRHGKRIVSEVLQRWRTIGPKLRDANTAAAQRPKLLAELTSPVSPDNRFLAHLGQIETHNHLEQARTALQLLRLSTAFHLGLVLPDAHDPLGDGPLRVQIDGDRATFAAADGSTRTCTRRHR